jgi:hypothetical protein
MVNRKQALVDALKKGSSSSWQRVALSALDDTQIVHIDGGSLDGGPVDEWLSIYKVRLKHSQENGIQAIGLAEFVQNLEQLMPNDVVVGELFGGPMTRISAFWDAAGNLVGCVTIPGWSPERGQENLDRVLGKH